VFANKVLRRTFGCKGEEVTGKQRKLHNKELQNLYCYPYIIRVIKPRMRQVSHILGMGDTKNVQKILVWKPKGRDHLTDP
jgi:hypothetical protein